MHTPYKPAFTRDEVRTLRSQGCLVFRHRKPDFVRTRADILFQGLHAIEAEASLRRLFLDGRDNKRRGRLLQGGFEKPGDGMIQFNFEGFGDDHINDYRRNAPVDFRVFFEAFAELNEFARSIDIALAQAIDDPLLREEPRHKISELLRGENTKTILSVTKYRAKSGTSETSACPNTAAFAKYLLVNNKNTGMNVLNKYGEIIDLSAIETDPEAGILITGFELSLVTEDMFEASMHPIFPQREDEMRETLRVFTYFDKNLIDRLREEREAVNKVLRS